MDGRLENELKKQKQTMRTLDKMPNFVVEWYYNLSASDLTAASCMDYVMKVSKFINYINSDTLNVKIDDVTENKVTEYMVSIRTKETKDGIKETSDSYRNTIWFCLNNFFNFLYKKGYIEKNYMDNIKKGKNRDLERINQNRKLLTSNDFNKILDEILKSIELCDYNSGKYIILKRDYALIMLLMTTGMRETALSSINIEDINIVDSKLNIIDKGNISHTYYLSDKVINVITEWIEERNNIKTSSNALFITRLGDRITDDAIYKLVKKHSKNAIGRSISPHKLRAGFVSIMYKKTHDIEFCRRAVGHSDISTTQRYITTTNKEKEESMNIMSDLLL